MTADKIAITSARRALGAFLACALALCGGQAGAATDDGSQILLNVGAVDTTSPEAAALRGAVGSFDGKRLHLAQFAGPIAPEWYRDLEATGVEVIQYVPSFAYLVYGDEASLANLQDMARTSAAVRWDGAYLDRYKIQRGAQSETRDVSLAADHDLFDIQLVRDPEANIATVAMIDGEALEPVKSRTEILKYVNLVVALPVEAVARIAAQPDVVAIDRHVMPEKFDERQDRIISGQLTGNGATPGDYLAYLAGKGFTQAQFTASNFVVDVTDSGIDNATTTPNHFGLRLLGNILGPGRVAYNRLEGTPHVGGTLQGCDGHGTLNSHIVAGYVPDPATLPVPGTHADGSAFRYGLGVCPFVKVGSSVIFDPDTYTSPNLANLQSKAYNDNARISTNSWGANTGGAYTVDSQTFDALVRDAQPAGSTFATAGNQEMVVVFSAGNAGSAANTIGSPGTGKNVIAVGASEGVQAFGGADNCAVADTGADSANDIIGFSSRGPTDDGRIKPEIVAPGTHISGGVFQTAAVNTGTGGANSCFDGTGVCGGPGGSNFFPTSQQFYSASSGTSHSAPAVAGGAALLRQHFINAALAPPTPAMTKAVLVNSARYMNGVAANDTLPSNNQGMGMMNLDTYFTQMAGARILRDQVPADMFTASGQQRLITGNVVNSGQPFRVTLAWTDAPGPTVGNSYVNNLDLVVTVGGVIYKGNVFSGAASAPGGVADPRNNVESVFVPAGVSGAFSVSVTATNIAGDGVPNVGGALDQDYALVIANATQVSQPVISSGPATILTDSCSPANGVLDPGEAATMSLCLQNTGSANTTNAVGTLQALGGVTSPSGPQNYGVLIAGGPAVCRDFTFTVAALSCGANVVPTLQVQDLLTDLGNVSWTFTTGVPVTVLTQNFDGVAAPALPAGWTSVSGAGVASWTTVITTPDTAPNDAFVNDPATVSDTSLVTPGIVVPVTTSPVVLSFRHLVDLEASSVTPTLGYDGGVLELKIGAGAFQDVITAGGSFVAGGYTHTISTLATDQNPLKGRQAWSGNSGGYITTTVNLPVAVSGQTIQLRWRRGSDQIVSDVGWRVDTISLQAGRACCVSALPIADLAITKTDGQASYVPGQVLTYTIVASNGGPDAVVGATVADTFPPDLTNVSWTCSASAGSACANPVGSGNINTTVNLLNGGNATFTVTTTASPAAAGSISNTATVTAPAGVLDAPGNNSATDTDSRTPTADLAITKTDGQTTALSGQPITYTIVASNPGPDAVIGATVSDTVPAAITGVSWSCSSSVGATCAPVGAGNINDTVNLPVGGSATYTLTGTISAGTIGNLSNTATVAVPVGMSDPDPTNNSVTDTDTVVGLDYFTIAPCRVIDTRGGAPIGGPILQGQQTRIFAVAGNCGIPSTAKAISINLAVTQPTATGNVRLFPGGQPVPTISSINYSVGQTRGNNAVIPLNGSGEMAAFVGQPAGTTVHLIIDVNGYFE